jgi:hypothetical protein
MLHKEHRRFGEPKTGFEPAQVGYKVPSQPEQNKQTETLQHRNTEMQPPAAESNRCRSGPIWTWHVMITVYKEHLSVSYSYKDML